MGNIHSTVEDIIYSTFLNYFLGRKTKIYIFSVYLLMSHVHNILFLDACCTLDCGKRVKPRYVIRDSNLISKTYVSPLLLGER